MKGCWVKSEVTQWLQQERLVNVYLLVNKG